MAVSREPVFYDQYGDRLLWERNRAHDSDQTILALGTLAPLLQPVDPRLVYAGPTAAPGLASFRRLQIADIEGLAVFTDVNAGLAPSSDGGTTNFLRADGRWATPPNLGTIATDLTVVDRTAEGLTVASSSGGDAVLPAATPALAGLISGADQDKLNTVNRGATANSSDAALRDRSSHTGTQPASTITGLAPSATTDTTNAANISSGVLSHQRLPVFAGLNPGAVPASLGAAKPQPHLYLREDGGWGSPSDLVEATAPLTLTRVVGGIARLGVSMASAALTGVLRAATAAQVSALYSRTGTPSPGDGGAAVTLAAAQNTLMPFNQQTLKAAAAPGLTSTVPVGVGTESQSATLEQVQAALMTYQQPGPGAVPRLTLEKVKEYCSLNEYLTLQLCVNSHNDVRLPAGNFILQEQLNIPRNNIVIRGAGVAKTFIKAAPTMVGHMIRMEGRNSCEFRDFSLDGNEAERKRGLASGATGFCVQGNYNRFYNLDVYDQPFYGLLIDGILGITSARNEVMGCRIRSNAATGLCLGGAMETRAIANTFDDNGYENMTIDLGSHNSQVIGNRFLVHRGGCGNVGWDDSDNSLFMGNFINGNNSVIPAEFNRNGVCINSEAGVTSGVSIIGNTILNCKDYGIWLRDRTGGAKALAQPYWVAVPSKPGSAVITSNYTRGSGRAGIRIDNTDELVVCSNNNTLTYEISALAANNVRMGAGEVMGEAQVEQRQLVPVNQFTKINFTTIDYARQVTLVGGTDFYPLCGGLLQIDCQVRLDVKTQASGIEFVQLRLMTPAGPRLKNLEFGSSPSVVDVELDVSFSRLLARGAIYAEVYAYAPSGGGVVVINPGPESWLSLVIAG